MRTLFVCASVACAADALAEPRADARYRDAKRLKDRGDPEAALAVAEEGLAIAPGDVQLLCLKATVLVLLDPEAALAASEACLAAGATGPDRRLAERQVRLLGPVRTTFLDITVANGPAAIHLTSATEPTFCLAAPSCTKGILPGTYKVVAIRAGFERWTSSVTVASDSTAKLAVTLVEMPSLVTVRTEPPGAHVTLDDRSHDAPAPVAAGPHRVAAALAGHATARLEIVAREGKPVELDVVLTPLVPIGVEPPGAAPTLTLTLDDHAVVVEDGGLPVPPGAHVLVARAPGFRVSRKEIPAVRPPGYRLVIELTPAEDAPSVGRSGAGARRLAGIGIAAGGGLALGVGFFFGMKARSTNADIRALCGEDRVCDSRPDFDRGNQLVADARSQATTATVLVAAGGAAVAAGVILWLTAPREHPSHTVRLVPSLGGRREPAIAVVGSF